MNTQVLNAEKNDEQYLQPEKQIQTAEGMEKSIPRQTEQKLSGMLLRLGIPAHVNGYRFLQDAVLTVMIEPDIIKHMMHDLYPRIASKNHTTAGRVERSIRSAIGLAWQRCRPEEYSRILGRSVSADYEKPTSCELIALVAERMKWYS